MTALERMTPRQLVAEMQAAGAVFSVNPRRDSLATSYTYSVRPCGDPARCREIIASAKDRPKQFYEAFRNEAARVAGETAEDRP